MAFALITGASQGLGKSLANQLAKRKIDLILISLKNEGLLDLGKALEKQYGVCVHCYETDLSHTDNVLSLAEKINRNHNINVLINIVGIGGSNKFTEVDCNYILKLIQINIIATTLLTRQLLPNLLNQTQGYILNISSLAAFSPIGFKTIYPASKSFIHSFSLGLRQELKKTNISVSVVNPGPMITNQDIRLRYEKQGYFGKLSFKSVDKVAKKSIDSLFKRKRLIIVNPKSWFLLQLLPTWIKCPLLTNNTKKNLLSDLK